MKAGVIAAFLIALAAPAFAQQPRDGTAVAADGAAVFKRACANCHADNQTTAPTPQILRQMTPEGILNALTLGRMQIQAISLSDAEQRAVSVFASGKPFGPVTPPVVVNKCSASPAMRAPAASGEWNGWGGNVANTRFQKNGGLTAADLPKLQLKWAYGYHTVTSARAQPTIAGGRLFIASENGEVHALDPKTGCTYWTFKAQTGVRTAMSVGPYKNAGRSGQAVFFGDNRANAYAVDANTGQQIWIRKVDDHRAAAITGAPTYHDGRVFVPVQGLNEEGQGGNAKYECCTVRGNISALNANTGEVLWKTDTIDAPKPRGKNKDGLQQWGPAGAGIWSSPTVDAKRGMVYIATGNNYADPSQKTSDAVIALDMKSGTIKWVNQTTPNDNWTLGCQQENPDNPNCPAKMGPDHDFSASPSLETVNGRDLLVLPQKSGMAYALDPDKEGEVAWQYRIGQGSGLGGQWGGAVDEQQAYFGVSDLLSPKPGGIRAVNLATGAVAWSVEPQERLCDPKRPTCRASQGAAVTVIPGAVFSGSLDGGMRAYSTKDGAILWTFDTNKEFPTINGVKANGGGLEGPGAIVSGGMLYFNSGYGGFVGNGGNVLLAFGID